LLADPSWTPIIEKTLGEKAQKMIYAKDGERPTRNVPTSKAERTAFVLTDPDILTLARWACVIEDHYGCPMDMEWAKDGDNGELFVVQARPETVQSRRGASAFQSYRIRSKGRMLVSGLSVGDAVVTGRVCLIENPRAIDRFVEGAILVTQTTDPDWVPIMKRAAAIVTDHGGRTSHAAIVSRERPACRRRRRQRDTGSARRPGGNGVVRRRRSGFRLRGLCRLRNAGARFYRYPGNAHPGNAQSRQSGGGIPLVADSR
jgi:pyruvate, water dikinase